MLRLTRAADYRRYPGKMDHATVLAFRPGRVPLGWHMTYSMQLLHERNVSRLRGLDPQLGSRIANIPLLVRRGRPFPLSPFHAASPPQRLPEVGGVTPREGGKAGAAEVAGERRVRRANSIHTSRPSPPSPRRSGTRLLAQIAWLACLRPDDLPRDDPSIPADAPGTFLHALSGS